MDERLFRVKINIEGSAEKVMTTYCHDSWLILPEIYVLFDTLANKFMRNLVLALT